MTEDSGQDYELISFIGDQKQFIDFMVREICRQVSDLSQRNEIQANNVRKLFNDFCHNLYDVNQRLAKTVK